jgi:MFS family permease
VTTERVWVGSVIGLISLSKHVLHFERVAADNGEMALRGRKAFWRVWVAQAISVTGDGMHRAALLWWAASTRSTGAVAVLALCSVVPVIVCSPFMGSLADRISRRRLMVMADVLRVATSAGLAAAIIHGTTPLAAIAGLTALAAVGESMFAPAFAASMSQLLPKEDRAAGNALNLANGAAGGLLGPAIGGLLVAAIGAGRVMALDSVTFVLSALIVGTTAIPALVRKQPASTSATEVHSGAVADRSESGWRIVTRSPEIRRLTLLASVLNLCTGPSSVLLVVLVVHRLHRGSAVYGLLDGCVAAGMLVGVFVVPRLARRSPSRALVVGLVVLGSAFVLTGTVPSPWWSGVMFVIVGGAAAVANSFIPTLFQSLVPEDQQGRVFGVVGSLAMGLRPVGLAAAGPLVAAVGATGGYAICGLGIVAATLVFARGTSAPSPTRRVAPAQAPTRTAAPSQV